MREGLRALLARERDLEIAFESVGGRCALDLLKSMRPDVLVVDLGLPGREGVELIREARAVSPATVVMVFSIHLQASIVRAALRAGAAGYVLKGAAPSEIIGGIRAVASGESFLSPQVASLVVNDIRRGPDVERDDPFVVLSARERQVLVHVAEGRTSKEIATCFSLSAKTVDGYRERIRKRLALRTTAEMVRYAVDRRLVDAE